MFTGDVMIWRRNQLLSGSLVFMIQYPAWEMKGIKASECGHFVCLHSPKKIIILKENMVEVEGVNSSSSREPSWNWSTYYEYEFNDKVISLS